MNKNKDTFTRSDIEASLRKEFPNLTKFIVSSSRLLKLPINKDAFQQNAKLTDLTYTSEKRSNGNIVNLFNYKQF